ncbi:MAG: hypothetical protein LUC43_07910 [Burkholderiales bacterium]|nr:hypothetical protein [Burkholderiales bacterium]
MLKLKDINKIRKLNSLGQSKRAISKITGVSRNTISKYIDCPDEIPESKKPGRASPLAPYTDQIKETFFKCGGNCELVRKAIIETIGMEVGSRNLRRFCQQWRPEMKRLKHQEFLQLRAQYRIRRTTRKSSKRNTQQAPILLLTYG